uniref:Uncharacterized protein n=1 Tax=Sander lucioperca TaxID=283035 RepID=A0A8C9YE54_SANLU
MNGKKITHFLGRNSLVHPGKQTLLPGLKALFFNAHPSFPTTSLCGQRGLRGMLTNYPQFPPVMEQLRSDCVPAQAVCSPPEQIRRASIFAGRRRAPHPQTGSWRRFLRSPGAGGCSGGPG